MKITLENAARDLAFEVKDLLDCLAEDSRDVLRNEHGKEFEDVRRVRKALQRVERLTADPVRELLQDAVDQWSGRFDTEEDINGADLVDWFGEFIRDAKKALEEGRSYAIR
jgi:hypothetical protein